jgi:predicted DNA-binding antitoxin AbrB/MazE fold protein
MVFAGKACEAEVKHVGTTIKARYSDGVLEPLEKLELTEGQEVTVTIISVPSSRDADFLTRTAGGWAGLIDAERLKREVNDSRLVTTRPEPRL